MRASNDPDSGDDFCSNSNSNGRQPTKSRRTARRRGEKQSDGEKDASPLSPTQPLSPLQQKTVDKEKAAASMTSLTVGAHGQKNRKKQKQTHHAASEGLGGEMPQEQQQEEQQRCRRELIAAAFVVPRSRYHPRNAARMSQSSAAACGYDRQGNSVGQERQDEEWGEDEGAKGAAGQQIVLSGAEASRPSHLPDPEALRGHLEEYLEVSTWVCVQVLNHPSM